VYGFLSESLASDSLGLLNINEASREALIELAEWRGEAPDQEVKVLFRGVLVTGTRRMRAYAKSGFWNYSDDAPTVRRAVVEIPYEFAGDLESQARQILRTESAPFGGSDNNSIVGFPLIIRWSGGENWATSRCMTLAVDEFLLPATLRAAENLRSS
jgi:hypothetical protein